MDYPNFIVSKQKEKVISIQRVKGSFVFLCVVFLMLSRLFIAALWSPAEKGLTSWLLMAMFIVFLLLSHVVSWLRCGVSLPDLCLLPYF